MRIALLVPFVLAAWAARAQPEQSLTPEFAGMSAKERARVAKAEQENAAKDVRFQGVMTEAEALFQQQRFDEALEKYKEARSLRPLNVFPKVKIQDLQALIAKRDAEAAKAKLAEPERTAPEVKVELDPDPGTKPTATAAGSLRPPVIEQKQVVVPPVRHEIKNTAPQVSESAREQAAAKPDGIQERTYVEGRAVVLERRVSRNGVEIVYRKVTHPWGQVVHFRDGIAISEREWVEAASGR
ncbi:MAG: tetratricopeptide repeat protein [Flavobacteriales bacterium]|jgi:tetratricopeptide (TPR) repeat protein|nr:tetratricopeptide repeat protein [Flavobacteriales bacterium]